MATMKAGRRPVGELERRMLLRAEPLDELTLKRAEFIEHAASSASIILAPSFDSASLGTVVGEIAAKRFRILAKLRELGDPVAAKLMSAGPADDKNVPDACRAFLDNGFLMDAGSGGMDGDTGHYRAYGVIFDKHDTGRNTLLIGSMFSNAGSVSWLISGHEAVTDVSFLMKDALGIVENCRFRDSEESSVDVLGPVGSALESSREAQQLRKETVDPAYLESLSSGPRLPTLALLLNALNYHSSYLCMKEHYAEDETSHVVAVLNGSIRDELVRACGELSLLPETIQYVASMAYGDTARTLSLIGRYSLAALTGSRGSAMGEIEDELAVIGNLASMRPMESALDYIRYFCSTPQDEIRESARRSLMLAQSVGIVPGWFLEEISGIGGKEFVGGHNLARVLSLYRHWRERRAEPRQGAHGPQGNGN